MPANPHFRKRLGWSAFALGLVGIGVALDFALPPQPRLVLRGAIAPGNLSADGTIATTSTFVGDPQKYASLKVWDTVTGRERGEVLKGFAPPLNSNGMCGPAHESLSASDIRYSSDGRRCALLHRKGLAIVDLQTCQERSLAMNSAGLANSWPQKICSEMLPVLEQLREPIDIKGLQEVVKLRSALQAISDRFAGKKLPILVDKEAFHDALGPGAEDPCEEEVSLPPSPAKMSAETALRLLVSQVGKAEATYLVRPGHVEITTWKRAREETVWYPWFSPQGSYVAIVEGRPKHNLLHIVASDSAELLATLPIHAEAYHTFGFSPDEQMLYYFADADGKPALTIWSTHARKVLFRFPELPAPNLKNYFGWQFSPDGRFLFADSCDTVGGGFDLIDLANGDLRRLFVAGAPDSGSGVFSIGGNRVVRLSRTELRAWDLPTGKLRASIALGPPVAAGHVQVSADGRRCVGCDSDGYQHAWDLEAGKLLWRRKPTHRGESRTGSDSILECQDGRVDIIDTETGEPKAAVSTRATDLDSVHIVGVTSDQRSVLTWVEISERNAPGLAEMWLGRWWPGRRASTSFTVSDLDSGRPRFHLEVREVGIERPRLSDDGTTLMTCWHDGDDTVISFFDVPARPSQFLVFGVPAAIAGLAMLARWWWGRRKPALPSGR